MPCRGAALYGQDAQHPRLASSYTDNGDGSVKDNNTSTWAELTLQNDRLHSQDAIVLRGSGFGWSVQLATSHDQGALLAG